MKSLHYKTQIIRLQIHEKKKYFIIFYKYNYLFFKASLLFINIMQVPNNIKNTCFNVPNYIII